MVRCKFTSEKQGNYQIKCPQEAKRNGYCIEHDVRQKTNGESSSESHLEYPHIGYKPLTKHNSRGVSNRERFSKKFGKKGKIKIREKVE